MADKPFDPRPMLRSFKLVHGPQWKFVFPEDFAKYGEPEDWQPEVAEGSAPVLTVDLPEAARRLCIGETKAKELIIEGKLKTIPGLGRTVRIATIELERFTNCTDKPKRRGK